MVVWEKIEAFAFLFGFFCVVLGTWNLEFMVELES